MILRLQALQHSGRVLFKMAEKSSVLKKSHHEQRKFSYSRPRYREARWERAVKVCLMKSLVSASLLLINKHLTWSIFCQVYTINLESKYLLIQGVPSVGATKELLELFALYGPVEE